MHSTGSKGAYFKGDYRNENVIFVTKWYDLLFLILISVQVFQKAQILTNFENRLLLYQKILKNVWYQSIMAF